MSVCLSSAMGMGIWECWNGIVQEAKIIGIVTRSGVKCSDSSCTRHKSSHPKDNRSSKVLSKGMRTKGLGPIPVPPRERGEARDEKTKTKTKRNETKRNETNHPDTTKQGEGNKKKNIKKQNCARVTYWQHCARSFFILLFILLLIALVRLGRWTLDGQCSWQQR